MKPAPTHEMIEALELCQKALSTMITPAQIDQTSTLQAFAIATEAEAKARAALSVQPAAAVVGEPVCFPEAADVPVRERIERLVRDVKAGAIIGYDGPQEYWSTRMGAEASAEIARLLAIALSVETAVVGTSSLIKRASEMTDEEIAAERAIVEDRINGEFCEGGGSPGEWYYERHDELSAEQKRRADVGGK